MKIGPCRERQRETKRETETEVDEVIIVERTAQYTEKHEVGAEGKLQPELLLWFGR